MFEDILGDDKVKEEKKKIKLPRNRINVRGVGLDSNKTDPPACKNCNHGSHILSNYPDKVLCAKYQRHKDFDYKCRNWELRK